jgi:hypothetical protein
MDLFKQTNSRSNNNFKLNLDHNKVNFLNNLLNNNFTADHKNLYLLNNNNNHLYHIFNSFFIIKKD